MDHAKSYELGVLETGDETQHPLLLAPLDLRLEADQAEVIAGERVLPQLHRRVRLAAGARIDEADRLHRSEAQRVPTAMRHHFNGQAALEEAFLIEVVHRRRLSRDECAVKRVVLVLRHRTVQVVAFVRLLERVAGRGAPHVPPHRDARNTFDMSIDSASTIGLMAS